jgi:ribonuclease J
MNLTIHRGTHEIGGTCIELESQGSRLILDLGMPLVDKKGYPFKLGKDQYSVEELVSKRILPNIPGLYSANNDGNINIILSHAHQDHYGFLRYAHEDIPVWMSAGSEALLKASKIFLPDAKVPEVINLLTMWEPVEIGPFNVTPYLADHSSPDAVSLLIEANGKRVFYSGDLRATGRKKVVFAKLIKNPPRDIDCLLLEGTMMGRGKQNFSTEESIEEEFVRLLHDQTNLAFIFCSGQNLDRLVSAFRACKKMHKTFVIDLYTAYVLDSLGLISESIPQYDWKEIRVKYWKSDADKIAKGGDKKFLYKVNKQKIEVEEIVERRCEILMYGRMTLFQKIAKALPNLDNLRMIWSMWKGYLNDSHPVQKFCGIHDINMKYIHTSGHATVEHLQILAKALNPKILIPIHTFEPEKYSESFENVRNACDGETIQI